MGGWLGEGRHSCNKETYVKQNNTPVLGRKCLERELLGNLEGS